MSKALVAQADIDTVIISNDQTIVPDTNVALPIELETLSGSLGVVISDMVLPVQIPQSGTDAILANVKPCQYIEPDARTKNATLGTFRWPVHGNCFVADNHPQLPLAHWVDSWDPNCYLSNNSTDWTSADLGPTTDATKIYSKKYGYLKSTGSNWANGTYTNLDAIKYYSTKTLKCYYSAVNKSITLYASNNNCTINFLLTYTYTVGSSRTKTLTVNEAISGQVIQVPDDLVSVTRLSISVNAMSIDNQNYLACSAIIPASMIVNGQFADVDKQYTLWDCSDNIVSVNILAATNDNVNEITLRAYPPPCEIYVVKGAENDADVIVSEGDVYNSPLSVSPGQIYSVVAVYMPLGKRSEVFYVDVPAVQDYNQRLHFQRMYLHGLPDLRVPVTLKKSRLAFPDGSRFASPGGVGSGLTIDNPGNLLTILSEITTSTNVYLTAGDYQNYLGYYNNRYATVYGGYNSDFTERKIHEYRSTFVQTIADTDPAQVKANGMYFRCEQEQCYSGIDLKIKGFCSADYTNCHVSAMEIANYQTGADPRFPTDRIRDRGGHVYIQLFGSITESDHRFVSADKCSCGKINIVTSGTGRDGIDDTENLQKGCPGGDVYCISLGDIVVQKTGDGGNGGHGSDQIRTTPGYVFGGSGSDAGSAYLASKTKITVYSTGKGGRGGHDGRPYDPDALENPSQIYPSGAGSGYWGGIGGNVKIFYAKNCEIFATGPGGEGGTP